MCSLSQDFGDPALDRTHGLDLNVFGELEGDVNDEGKGGEERGTYIDVPPRHRGMEKTGMKTSIHDRQYANVDITKTPTQP
jgi:hypothetical protein